MANYISFLRGLASVSHLSTLSGLSERRLLSYISGAVKPRADTLQGLRQVYKTIQTTRLRAAGLPYRQAVRMATSSQRSVNSTIRDVNSVVKGYARSADVDEAIIRDRYSQSEKTVEELTEENYVEYVASLRARRTDRS